MYIQASDKGHGLLKPEVTRKHRKLIDFMNYYTEKKKSSCVIDVIKCTDM